MSFTTLPLYPDADWIRGWRSENLLPYRESNSKPLVVQPVASRYTDYVATTISSLFIIYTGLKADTL
jgi:hypothetical protein